jgi:predicted RNase H-like HicB family nuclease
MNDHGINVFWSEKDERYVADIPDLKYCSALGSTPEEAVREVVAAKQAWLETARSTGKPVKPTHFHRHHPDELPA